MSVTWWWSCWTLTAASAIAIRWPLLELTAWTISIFFQSFNIISACLIICSSITIEISSLWIVIASSWFCNKFIWSRCWCWITTEPVDVNGTIHVICRSCITASAISIRSVLHEVSTWASSSIIQSFDILSTGFEILSTISIQEILSVSVILAHSSIIHHFSTSSKSIKVLSCWRGFWIISTASAITICWPLDESSTPAATIIVLRLDPVSTCLVVSSSSCVS